MGLFDKVKTVFILQPSAAASGSVSANKNDIAVKLVEDCLAALGGRENIASPVQLATTRIRVELLNPERLDRDKLKVSGLLGHMLISETVIHLLAGDQTAVLAKGLQS